MRRLLIAAVLGTCATATAVAQPPRKLPTSLDPPDRERPAQPAVPAKPLSPSEATKQRDAIIKALKEEIVSFNSSEVAVTKKEGRWKVHTRSVVLKDFGDDRTAAHEAARIIQDLRVNQLGSVPGAQPAFEYWLADGKAPKGMNSKLVVIPVSARTIRAEEIGGAWMLTDGMKGVYNFGTDADAAKRAAVVYWKYGFNQLGVVGTPQPTMLLPLLDPRQATQDRASPLPNPMPLGVLNDAAKSSLLLPGNVYAGPKTAFDATKLQATRDAKGWALTYNGDELARFGSDEPTARAALKALQSAKPTELVRVGDFGMPIFLSDGQAIRSEPLGVTKVSLRTDLMKVQKVRDT